MGFIFGVELINNNDVTDSDNYMWWVEEYMPEMNLEELQDWVIKKADEIVEEKSQNKR